MVRRRTPRRTAMGTMMAGLIGSATRAMIKAAVPKPAAKKAAPPKARGLPVVAGRSGRFTKGRHDGPSGARDYRLYLSSAARVPGALVPLVVMLHGCGQTPDDFAKGTRMNVLAERSGLIVLYPAQSRDAHPNRCWNWFRDGDQARGSGEPAILADMVRAIIDDHPVDPARVYVAGLSAGASAAMVLAHAYPELFAAVGCHSGLAVGAARDGAGAMLAMRQGNPGTRLITPMPTIIFHGDEDRVVAPRNGRFLAIRALEPFARLDMSSQTKQVAQGRPYVRTLHRIGRGRPYVEHWLIRGSGHAWSGGSRTGRFVDPAGPDASQEMVRFFLRHRISRRGRPVSG